MTERTAEKIAPDAAWEWVQRTAYIVVRTPRLRRLAIGLAVTALSGALPAWLTREAQHAWVQSRRRGI